MIPDLRVIKIVLGTEQRMGYRGLLWKQWDDLEGCSSDWAQNSAAVPSGMDSRYDNEVLFPEKGKKEKQAGHTQHGLLLNSKRCVFLELNKQRDKITYQNVHYHVTV